MLTVDQIYNNQLKYVEILCKLNIDLTDLVKYLESVDYFKKPFASQGDFACAGGLCKYALNLYYELSVLANAYLPGKYSEEDLIKVAFFKDIYRAELYESYQKNVKNEQTGEWETIEAYRYRDQRPVFGDLGLNSFMITKKFFELTDEQAVTIIQANSKESYAGDIHEILKRFPLLTLIRMADIAATYLGE